jgi:hypothetical protein
MVETSKFLCFALCLISSAAILVKVYRQSLIEGSDCILNLLLPSIKSLVALIKQERAEKKSGIKYSGEKDITLEYFQDKEINYKDYRKIDIVDRGFRLYIKSITSINE